MRFQFALTTLVVVASAAIASPSFKRDGTLVLADISVIEAAINDWGDAWAAYPTTGGTSTQDNVCHANTSINIVEKEQAFGTAIIKATTDATASPPFSEFQSAAIVAATERLKDPLAATFGAITSKIKRLILSIHGANRDPWALSNATHDFGVASLQKISADQQGNEMAVFTEIFNEFDNFIASLDADKSITVFAVSGHGEMNTLNMIDQATKEVWSSAVHQVTLHGGDYGTSRLDGMTQSRIVLRNTVWVKVEFSRAYTE
ncbi:hypothetical protein BD410DRAFT_808252 [Rickenella mellea]|uniref:Uncharacterized protein n=1 Tax=Rickenella mellea TaxID=50990 RepID=A0A4Y7PM15_9AGAM|nr:hypothetical protein BD410DRAFT_808252 [Rickenella mellea]